MKQKGQKQYVSDQGLISRPCLSETQRYGQDYRLSGIFSFFLGSCAISKYLFSWLVKIYVDDLTI